MGFEWIVIWLLALATFRVVKVAAVDAWEQCHGRPAPSLLEREKRAELAQRQFEMTGTPGVGQAIADRFAIWIANPKQRSAWIREALGYIVLLLADAFAYLRRRHVEKQRDRETRENGEQPRRGRRGGPYCVSCEYNHVARDGDLCEECTPVVMQQCPGCGYQVPAAQLGRHDRCEACRREAEQVDPDTPTGGDAGSVLLVVPGEPTAG